MRVKVILYDQELDYIASDEPFNRIAYSFILSDKPSILNKLILVDCKVRTTGEKRIILFPVKGWANGTEFDIRVPEKFIPGFQYPDTCVVVDPTTIMCKGKNYPCSTDQLILFHAKGIISRCADIEVGGIHE